MAFIERCKRLLANREFVLGIVVLGAFALVALAAPLLAPPQGNQPYLIPKEGFSRAPTPPRPGHPMGSLPNGYDVAYGLVWGTRVAFVLGGLITLGRVLIGLLVGLAAGFQGGWLDGLLMRLTDAFLTFPIMAIAAVLLALFSQPTTMTGPPAGIILGSRGNQLTIATLVLFGWMQYARLARGNLLVEKEKEYIQAAIATGAGRGRLLFRHLLPNATRGLFELATSEIGTMVVLIAAFRFVGLTGVTSGEMLTDWGLMLTASRDWISGASNQAFAYWYTYVPTSLAILFFSIGWNLVGEGVRQALDPRAKPAFKPKAGPGAARRRLSLKSEVPA
ncbi:MAG: ABC transporter permease [Anaerolineales bacterium]|nr:ABC transporter permease [Anaerolineales bacterium]